MRPAYTYPRGAIYRAKAEDIYPTLEPGSVRLVISDGPYGMGKADWDRQRGDDGLREWYRPHVEAWGRVCAPSATVYVWGTDDSASALRGLMAEHGWTRRVRVTWDKGVAFMAGKCDLAGLTRWYDVTEVCDMYTRDALSNPGGAGQAIAYAAGSDDRNWIRVWLAAEWDATGLRRKDADAALGRNGMAGHYFGSSQWMLPTWEAYQQLAAHAAKNGPPRERPYFVHPEAVDLAASYDHLRTEYDHLRTEYDHLRAEYEAQRVPFSAPAGVSNVWSTPQVSGHGRLSGEDGQTLHPCQKPLLFASRMVLASSRPGDLVLEPFGGTCRVAVAVERLSDSEARRYVCVEPDLDGRGYLEAVDRSLRSDLAQTDLFRVPR